MAQIKYIAVQITLDNGVVVQGSLASDADQRWGADRDHLASCVRPMRLMHEVLTEADCWAREES